MCAWDAVRAAIFLAADLARRRWRIEAPGELESIATKNNKQAGSRVVVRLEVAKAEQKIRNSGPS